MTRSKKVWSKGYYDLVNKVIIHGLLVEEKTYEEMAFKLQIGIRAIKHHIHRLAHQYGVQTSPNKLLRIQVAVAIFKAGHCPCSDCQERLQSRTPVCKPTTTESMVRVRSNAFMSKEVHVEEKRTRQRSVLDLPRQEHDNRLRQSAR
jgi:DNA-binding CsgD family transcriptional regulator